MGVLGELFFLYEGYIIPVWETVLSSFVQQLIFAIGDLIFYRVDGKISIFGMSKYS